MTQNKWLLHLLLISCVLSTTVVISQVALAGYQPPDDQKPPKDSSDSSGVRVMDETRFIAFLQDMGSCRR